MKWMDVAKSLVGTKESPGSANSATIISWAKGLGGWIGQYYTKDEIPWCGLFVAHCMRKAGLSFSQSSLSARAWANWGQKCEPQYGAVLVFSREGGGHVGFYHSESKTHYRVLGGNQRDQVTDDALIDKSRLLVACWPSEVPLPGKGGKVVAEKLKGINSRNES